MTATSLLLLTLSGCEFLPFISDAGFTDRFDLDRDGAPRPDDCDDQDAAVSPSADEICDGTDNDCDGDVDENDSVDATSWYADSDSDGYGFGVAIVQCDDIAGYATTDGDCDDQDSDINPDASEVCDETDNDCDDEADNDPIDGTLWYPDADDDSFGDASGVVNVCTQPDGYVSDATDCDDQNPAVNPNAIELCEDEVDNNCNGETDEDASYTTQYADADDDEYGDVNNQVVACNIIDGYVSDATDCDDNDANVNPGVTEVCNNGVDDNCDGGAGDCVFEGEIVASDAIAILAGESSEDMAVVSVAGVGDIDGDGYDDVLVGANMNDRAAQQAGIVYLVRGPITMESNLSDAYATFIGVSTNDYSGTSVASAGDLNNDGYTDFIIGAPSSSLNGSQSGAVYIVNGPVSGTQSLSDADRILTGHAESDFTGYSIAGIGDLNSDGYDDVLIGAYMGDTTATDAGVIYVDFGPGATVTEDLTTSGGLILNGEQASDLAGISVASAGDINTDGVPDILVGASSNDYAGSGAGAAYLLYGPRSGGITISLADADMKLTGEDAGDSFGRATSGAGDINNDGYDDFLVGAPNESSAGDSFGAAYLIVNATYGTENIATNGQKFIGENGGDLAGTSLSGAGDIDLDGNDDLLIGAYGSDGYGLDVGTVYCIFGPVTAVSNQLSSSRTIMYGEAVSDYFGVGIAPAGDTNADGFTDIIIGAHYNDNTGSAYIFSWLEL